MRRLVDAEDLVHELMRDLVLENVDDLAPRALEDQRTRQLERAKPVHPATELCPRVGQREHGRA
jgi:hypothetical protein